MGGGAGLVGVSKPENIDGVRALCPGVHGWVVTPGEDAEGEIRERRPADKEDEREWTGLRGPPGDKFPYREGCPPREAMSILPPPMP